jgi:eukaryotic-like serine/threonine-protein kinase
VIGRTVGQYTIVARLGEGATGEVYQAEHSTLHHLVAIKILRPEFMAGEAARSRFLREAKLAAAIDSPAVCNVIDVGEFDGRSYLVMRYCAGVNLRDLLAERRLTAREAVLYAIQIAEGLAAAHARGIVHRDIKPSNIVIAQPGAACRRAGRGSQASTVFLSPDGPQPEQAKIIDFGLALLPDHTRLTLHGGRAGTPEYMAPEQVAGGKLDRRTDIWGLGAVLHEMATGKPPFGGETVEAIMHAIQHADPRIKTQPDAAVPAKLGWIIEHALQKDPARRYATIQTMLQDLRRLHCDLHANARDVPTWVVARRRWLAWTGVAVASLAAVALVVDMLRPASDLDRGLAQGRPLPLTGGNAFDSEPAVSPDGSRIAFTRRLEGQADIYVVGAQGGSPQRLTDDPHDDYAPAWFPDGGSLAFVSDRLGRPDVWKMSQYGEGAMLLLADARDPAISPDGRRLAFVRDDRRQMARIGVVDLDAPGDARLLTGPQDGLWSHRDPAWSLDGSLICYSSKNNLWLLDPHSGQVRPLTHDGREDSQPCWSTTGRHVYFTSMRDNVYALWRIRLGARQPERLTLGAGGEQGPSVDAAGRVFVYCTRTAGHNSLVIEDRRGGRRTVSDAEHDDSFPSLTPDGRWLAFTSDRWGDRAEVWLQELADGQPAGVPWRLTEQVGSASNTAISPDGAWIAYYRFVGAVRNVWVVPTGGGEPSRLTSGDGTDVQPAWSPDGTHLAYISDRTGEFAIWLMPVADGRTTGPSRRLTPEGVVALMPIWSPDGTQLAFTSAGEVWIIPADGGAPPRQVTHGAGAERLRWEAQTGRIWVSGSWGESCQTVRTIWPDGGPAEPVEPPLRSAFANQFLFFDISRDASVLAWAVDDPRGRIWLLRADGSVF